jgi:hypothetical protein
MKKTNVLARHYSSLTPEERFRLILAAGARGDKAEQDRLVNSGQRISLSVQDHAPYAHAFDELARLAFLELLEEAAHYLDLFARAGRDRDVLGDQEEEDGNETAEGEVNSGEEDKSEAKAGADAEDEVAGDRCLGERYLDMALAAGFVLRTKAEGWQLFCGRITVPAFVLWEGLPGFDRLQHALQLSERAAFVAEGFLRWLNGIRPAGEPEWVTMPLTAESLAAATAEAFQERVAWWGG